MLKLLLLENAGSFLLLRRKTGLISCSKKKRFELERARAKKRKAQWAFLPRVARGDRKGSRRAADGKGPICENLFTLTTK